MMIRRPAVYNGHTARVLRVIACIFLLFLPLFFPHSPWKPEETRVVGILLKYLNHEAPGGALMPSVNRAFWGVILIWEHWSHSRWPLENVARVTSVIQLVLGALALYGWARAMHRRYPNMVPASICAGAPLLVASSLGMLVRGYQATPESAWFAGVSAVLWAGAEPVRWRRLTILGLGALWLWTCGNAAGLLLSVLCGSVIPWVIRWKSGGRSPVDRVEGALALLAAIILFAVSRLEWLKEDTWLATGDYLLEVSRVLVWYALPAWPLALAVWWRGPRLPERIRTEWKIWRWEPVVQCIVVLLIGAKIGNIRWQESHVLMSFPFLIIMALPALYLVDVRSWFNAVHWFTRSVLILGLVSVWGVVSAQQWKVPFSLYQHLEAYQPGFDPRTVSMVAWGLSIVLTAYALRYLIVPCKTLHDSLWRWALGFGCTACVIRLMLVPYIDYGRSYRSAMLALSAAVPSDSDAVCVELMPSVQSPQRAMWQYYTKRSSKLTGCPWRIAQGYPKMSMYDRKWFEDSGYKWQMVIQVRRPGERQETFFLMHKVMTPLATKYKQEKWL